MYGVEHFALMGMLGGLAYALVWATEWRELLSFQMLRHVLVGAIIGYVYYFLHYEHGFPDSVAAFVSGYAGVDFINAIVMRFLGQKPPEKKPRSRRR